MAVIDAIGLTTEEMSLVEAAFKWMDERRRRSGILYTPANIGTEVRNDAPDFLYCFFYDSKGETLVLYREWKGDEVSVMKVVNTSLLCRKHGEYVKEMLRKGISYYLQSKKTILVS